jgi:hypothetical protein
VSQFHVRLGGGGEEKHAYAMLPGIVRTSRLGPRLSIYPRQIIAKMSTIAPPASPFRLALIQMGGVTSNKEQNIAHAKDLILQAAKPQTGQKPGVIVLPVSDNRTSSTVFS